MAGGAAQPEPGLRPLDATIHRGDSRVYRHGAGRSQVPARGGKRTGDGGRRARPCFDAIPACSMGEPSTVANLGLKLRGRRGEFGTSAMAKAALTSGQRG